MINTKFTPSELAKIMKASKTIATYQRLRNQPLWRLLAADNGPVIIALLQNHLLESTQGVPASLFYERIGRDIKELRAQGQDFPQTAQAYVADWLSWEVLCINADIQLTY